MKKEYNLIEKMKYNNKKSQKDKFAHEDVIVKDKKKEIKQEKTDKKNNVGKLGEEKVVKTKEAPRNKVNGIENRPDSPGIDLSVFAPRGKRKCVLQNEAKKQKSDWWSDEEEIEGDEKDVEEGDEIGTRNESEKKSPIIKRKRTNSKNVTKETFNGQGDDSAQSVQCYVFSTGMANRAGHCVTKGVYKTITEYHHAQQWNTPYLNAEVHCRPFHPALEEEEEMKDLVDLRLLPKKPKEPAEINNIDIACATRSLVVEERKEQLLSVDKWQKEQLIQAAQQMNRLSQRRDQNEVVNKAATNLRNPKKVERSDSEASPQTVPKYNENNAKEDVTIDASVFHSQTFDGSTIPAEDEVRKKELNSPLQLVPSIASTSTEVVKSSTSYPADITNLKEQLRYNSPKPEQTKSFTGQHEHRLQSSNHLQNHARPTVLSMATDHRNNEPITVRSSLDMAEKQLKESKTAYKPGVPILPRDIHPSLFLSRHSPQIQPPTFKGTPSTTSVPAFPISVPRTSSSFNPPLELHSQNHLASLPRQMSLFRHTLHSRPNYNELESMSDKCKLTSSFNAYHVLNNDRPSSLPILPTANRPETHPHKSFSVESLTKTGNDPETAEKHSPHIPVSSGAERTSVVTECFREYLPVSDRIHIPTNGINIHNGLKRSLDEQLLSNHIMERAQRDKSYLEPLVSERYLLEKERSIYDQKRYLHQSRLPFHAPRSPMRVPSSYVPATSLTNGGEHDDNSTSVTQHSQSYLHVQRSNQHPYLNR